jgi:hypothetical protein
MVRLPAPAPEVVDDDPDGAAVAGVVESGVPGTDVVGVASLADSVVAIVSPSYEKPGGSLPSPRYAERAAERPSAVDGRASGP